MIYRLRIHDVDRKVLKQDLLAYLENPNSKHITIKFEQCVTHNYASFLYILVYKEESNTPQANIY